VTVAVSEFFEQSARSEGMAVVCRSPTVRTSRVTHPGGLLTHDHRLHGDDGWYFGDVSASADEEPMCWMASRRLPTIGRYVPSAGSKPHTGDIRRVIRSAGNLCLGHRLLVRYST
jgi:hypothetical protein